MNMFQFLPSKSVEINEKHMGVSRKWRKNKTVRIFPMDFGVHDFQNQILPGTLMQALAIAQARHVRETCRSLGSHNRMINHRAMAVMEVMVSYTLW